MGKVLESAGLAALATTAILTSATGCDESDIRCGDGTINMGGLCVPTLDCGPGTVADNGRCVPAQGQPLLPGNWQAPLVQLQRLQGDEDHMHIAQVKYRESDKKLFYCSYTFGMIDASDPQDMSYDVQGLQHTTPSGSPRTPGCLHLAWDDANPDIVYTSHRGNIDFARFLSGWDLGDTDAPVQLPALQEPDTRYGGLDVENGHIYVALQEGGLGIYDYAASEFTRIGTATGLTNAWAVAVRGNNAYVADGIGGLATVDVTNPAAPTFIARTVFGGNAEDIVIDGDVAYVAAGSAGLVLVDISNAAAPVVLSSVKLPGSAVGVAYHSSRAYVAAWNDVRVYDVATPTQPRFIGATRQTVSWDYEYCSGNPRVCVPDDTRPDPTARTLAVAAFEDYVFVGNWWVPYSFKLHPERKAPYMVLPEDVHLIDFGPTPPGSSKTHELVVSNEGTAPLTLYDNHTNNGPFSVSPAQVLIPAGESATLTLTFGAYSNKFERNLLWLRSDDPSQQTRVGYLVANQPGLGVGKALPDVHVTLTDQSSFSTAPLTGNVMVLAYFATF